MFRFNILLLASLALAFGGCATQTGYTTLKTIGITVDTGMAAYSDAVNQGRVPPATQQKVKDAFPKFYTAYHNAVDVLKMNLEAPAPPDVATQFSQLLALISPFVPQPKVPTNPYPVIP